MESSHVAFHWTESSFPRGLLLHMDGEAKPWEHRFLMRGEDR